MSGLVPGRPRTAAEAIERIADEALARADAERLAELRAHPKQVEMKYLIDGREATQQELEDLAQIQAEHAEAQQRYVDTVLAIHRRALSWIRLVNRLDARARKVVTA